MTCPDPPDAQLHDIAATVADWYLRNRRELPWRGGGATPWRVMVSEFMLQQTPVARVLPVFERWVDRWPAPVDLAGASSGEAIRMWGKLGYPRRAVRLHAAATAIVADHGGRVPDDPLVLRTLPGIGEYTAAAIAAFAYGRRIPVVDTNVRRVVHRAVLGSADAGPATTKADVALTETLLPPDDSTAATVSIGLMELGALICTAKSPACDQCPLTATCAWVAAGRPAYDGPPKRTQSYEGTDRHVRGLILDVLRNTDGPVTRVALDAVWPEDTQRLRALDTLLADGLLVPAGLNRYALPG